MTVMHSVKAILKYARMSVLAVALVLRFVFIEFKALKIIFRVAPDARTNSATMQSFKPSFLASDIIQLTSWLLIQSARTPSTP